MVRGSAEGVDDPRPWVNAIQRCRLDPRVDDRRDLAPTLRAREEMVRPAQSPERQETLGATVSDFQAAVPQMTLKA